MIFFDSGAITVQMFLRQDTVIQLPAIIMHAEIAFEFFFKSCDCLIQSCFGKYHTYLLKNAHVNKIHQNSKKVYCKKRKKGINYLQND